MKIILTGYMGSGKSVIAKKLSEKVRIPSYDLDKIIEEREGMSVKSVFDIKGEVYFRKAEHNALKRFIEENDKFILSLGGGTPCYAGNHLILQKPEILSVYLKTSVGELVERLSPQKTERPLLSALQDDELNEFVAKHLFDRSYYYHHAKHIITTDQKSPEDIADEIIDLF